MEESRVKKPKWYKSVNRFPMRTYIYFLLTYFLNIFYFLCYISEKKHHVDRNKMLPCNNWKLLVFFNITI